jgi:hypothetical protein
MILSDRNIVKTLVLCRTPFQAVMISEVLGKESIKEYDLVYFTQNDSEEDNYYFRELLDCAEIADYIFIKRQRFDVLNHIELYRRTSRLIKDKCYDVVIVSSYDNLAFLKLAVKNLTAKIISFDDGVGYISKSSSYTAETSNVRSILYRLLFRVPPRGELIARISRHYSCYPAFKNIMPEDIISYVRLFEEGPDFIQNDTKRIKLFIGQPFSEMCDLAYERRLKSYLNSLQFDFYVKHPREDVPLLDKIRLLDKHGRIAEQAIFEACGDSRPELWGPFSTVLLNIDPKTADKIMILSADREADSDHAKIAEKAGCKVIFI